MLGSVRIGPDLSNVGTRLNRSTLMRLLLDPKSIRRNSKMPQHRFLFDVVKESNEKGIITIRNKDEQVFYKPTKEAEALVDYLLSLKSANYPLEEAPVYQPFTSSLPKPEEAKKEMEEKTGDEGSDTK